MVPCMICFERSRNSIVHKSFIIYFLLSRLFLCLSICFLKENICLIFESFADVSLVSSVQLSNYGATCRGGWSRAAATSKMERFVIIVNGWQPLTIITKCSILDVAAALDPPLTWMQWMHKSVKIQPSPLSNYL